VPRPIIQLLLAVLILASLIGGRPLVANVADGSQHVVKPGETLSGIAAQYGLTVDQLTTANGLADPNRLVEGQTLKLPPKLVVAQQPAAQPSAPSAAVASAPPPAAAPVTPAAPSTAEYVVQTGDTLGGIAKSLGVSLKALLDANELADPDRLRVGQKLAVPGGTAQAGAQQAVPAGRSNQPGAPAAGSPGAASAAPAVAIDDPNAVLNRLAQQYGIDANLAKALAWLESDGKPVRLDAPGAVGYLTVTDKTFDYIQATLIKRTLDRAVPGDNLEAGVAYVATMLKWGGEDARGLAGFLQGPGSVNANGVRPAIDEQVKRILALRERIKLGTTDTRPAQPVAAPPPPPPTAAQVKPPEPESPATLTARVINAARAVAGSEARIGIAGRNLVTGQRLGVASDQSFPAASVGKLPLLIEIYRQTFAGTLTLTEPQRADLRAMIVSSDNDAANRLMEQFTTRAVNANLQALGLAGTRLVNPFGLANASAVSSNVTTPADMNRLLEMLAAEQLVSPQASREMRGLLLQSQDGSKLRRGLPADARIAHKSGWYDGVANDAGIISHGQSSYVLSVFTDGIADADTANEVIAVVSQIVYGAWGPPQTSMAPVSSRIVVR
jgi:LysM repeat protein/beta-lactamase class A